MRRLAYALSAALLVLSGTALAAGTACPMHFAAGQAPDLTNPRLAIKAREICYRQFALMHSGVTRTPLWSAQYLTREELRQADTFKRKTSFHPDPHLQRDERAELRDYARSGFDRGHMTPAGDMATPAAQYESFSLANIAPQHPRNNQLLWERIESAVRDMVRERGELYIITGPLFLSAELERIGGRVIVPSHIYKLVYDPRSERAAAYLVDNVATNEYRTISLLELERLAGIDFMPGMTQAAKAAKLELPAPRRRGRG